MRSQDNKIAIDRILKRHSAKNSVRLISYANVGNHLHLHIHLGYREGYKPFIRAITAAIAMHVMQWNRWTLRSHDDQSANTERKSDESILFKKTRINVESVRQSAQTKEKFWDFRPYTNVVTSWTGFKNLRNYVKVNQYEGMGIPRKVSQELVQRFTELRAHGMILLARAAQGTG